MLTLHSHITTAHYGGVSPALNNLPLLETGSDCGGKHLTRFLLFIMWVLVKANKSCEKVQS